MLGPKCRFYEHTIDFQNTNSEKFSDLNNNYEYLHNFEVYQCDILGFTEGINTILVTYIFE